MKVQAKRLELILIFMQAILYAQRTTKICFAYFSTVLSLTLFKINEVK